MYKKIVVAIDGSENSQRAFNYALNFIDNLEDKENTELHIISVIQIIDLPEIVENQALIDYYRKYYKNLHNDLTEKAKEKEIKIFPHILIGNPSVEIVNFIKENEADLIILGRTGKSKIEQWLLGSVSKRIIDHSPCPVLLVN